MKRKIGAAQKAENRRRELLAGDHDEFLMALILEIRRTLLSEQVSLSPDDLEDKDKMMAAFGGLTVALVKMAESWIYSAMAVGMEHGK